MATRILSGVVNEHLNVELNGSVWDYYYDSYPEVLVSNHKTSVDTGGFVPGVYRVNPYSVSAEAASDTGGGYGITWIRSDGAVYKHVVTGAINLKLAALASSYTPVPDHSNFRDRALQKAYSKLGDADLELGETIGELKQTIDMIRSPLRSLREFLSRDGARNANILNKLLVFAKTGTWIGVKDKAKGAKAAADAWLEFRYGFRPLVLTIQGIIEQVNKKAYEGFSPTIIRSKRSNLSKTVSSSSPEISSPLASQSGCRVTFDYELTQGYYASVQYRQSRPSTHVEKYGLSIPYLPETVWELTRLSFVVDWFMQIGPWLGTLRYKPHIQVLGNTIGTKVETRVSGGSCELWSSKDPSRTTVGTMSVGGAFERRSYDRLVNHNLPVLPQFTGGDVIDLFRSIDSAALIVQKMRKYF